ncbi:hypothetical protein BGZ98_000633 [Dissophora globulifera]|nr:hypothetical protein BGZ98_000633 [Dissophora globulifera]
MASNPSPTTPPVPEVIIVGAGLSGLLLGILLERAKIPFNIYERAPSVKPLGAIMSLNVNILPALEQLGLMDELKKIWLPSPGFTIYSSKLKSIATATAKDYPKKVGYDIVVFARPPLYDLLLSKLPAERIHFNKKIVSITQDEHNVTVTCADGDTIRGDILVGADGAYSSVRRNMYKEARKAGVLPKVDTQNLSQGYITMVGTTDPLDLKKYPDLKDDYTHFAQMIGKKGTPYTWSTFTVPDRKICWSVQLQLNHKTSNQMFKNSEWAPESNEKMIKDIYNFKTPYGVLGDLIDATPKERISRVALEDKLFETWHHGRCVLIGDAAHKLLPSAGQGAVNALQDSVILANCLYDLRSLSTKDVTAAFNDYHEQRRPFVTYQFNASRMQAKVMFGQTLMDRIIRHIAFKYLPESVRMKEVYKSAAYRPQASFLPLVEKRGVCKVLPQQMSKRYLAEQKAATAKQN